MVEARGGNIEGQAKQQEMVEMKGGEKIKLDQNIKKQRCTSVNENVQ